MARFTLAPALDRKSTVANLIQPYLHDLTGFMPFPVGSDGRFAYDHLERFWRHPYLIMADDEIAGFALVIDDCPLTGRAPCWFMAEFFVLRAWRGHGAGRTAIAAAVAAHPGPWHLGVPLANRAGIAFWSKALADYRPAVRDLRFDGDAWRLHAFTAPVDTPQ